MSKPGFSIHPIHPTSVCKLERTPADWEAQQMAKENYTHSLTRSLARSQTKHDQWVIIEGCFPPLRFGRLLANDAITLCQRRMCKQFKWSSLAIGSTNQKDEDEAKVDVDYHRHNRRGDNYLDHNYDLTQVAKHSGGT